MKRLTLALSLAVIVPATACTSNEKKAAGSNAVEPIDTGSRDTASPTPLDYGEPGPHSVGVAAFDATVSSGTTPALVWYPSAESGPPFEYFPLIAGVASQDITPDCTNRRPVIVHSHGSGSTSLEMAWLAEHLASHGIVTVALDHIGNTYYEETNNFARLYEQRPTDVAELYDLLVRDWSGAGDPLDGCIDANAGYTVSGYSFGGYTAYAVGGARVEDPTTGATFDFSDPRATAVVTFAPWNGGGVLGSGMGDITVPTLTVGAARDRTVYRQYESLHGALTTTPRVLADFPEAGHYTFIEFCNVYLYEDGCGDSWVDLEAFKFEVARGTAAFMGYLSGDPEAPDLLVSDPEFVTWTVETE
ncbi:MAG: hypothetical protein CL927_05755 [Deltaproteobacteria bacterium]|nr:hypothetical protein [Deltaproteobacteria bacterium]HCH65299.1 hypothetical protein [Deltaproteobacteria bacterium]